MPVSNYMFVWPETFEYYYPFMFAFPTYILWNLFDWFYEQVCVIFIKAGCWLLIAGLIAFCIKSTFAALKTVGMLFLRCRINSFLCCEKWVFE